ncbi:TPA: tail fiber domain-containing protein [Streptococcus pneumoniae]|nr:tail fiber domain-containing protein [Streptococcus pneumoniae]
MIYLTEGNTPLNEAYNDEIVHLGNNTYQLTFRFPTSDPKWELLKEETFLTADDLHGEQDFYIFEVEKQQGYIQVYANQVISLLNNYIVSSIEVDRVSGTRVLSAFAGSITRANPFSFFSDIDDRHTLNIKDKNAMEVLAKGKHSILGQWGGDMVRNGYNLRLLKNGGSENESLFMYKKNLSSYQHKTSTKSLKTRITFKTTVKGEGENAVDHDYMVVIDSPLLGNYSQIYEDVVEVNDQDVTDEASLIEYGKQYFRTSMCDMLEDNLEISVVGQSDVAVQMFDVVSFYHEWYGLDVRKKITKYTYSPMAKLLKSIGFGTFQSSLANAIGGIVNDAVLNESRNLHQIFEERLKKEIANADRAFDAEFSKREKTITDAIELAKAKAEEVKQELSDTINQRFNSFDNGPLKEAKRKAEEALRNAGASSSLAQESKRIGLDSVARLEAFKSQTTSAQTALSGDLDVLKRTIANDIRPKQAQAEAEIAKQVEALSRTKNELSGASTLLAQEAKRIELDSVARLEAFKSQTTSAQTALSGDLDVLKRTIANDIRPKQAQAEAEIAKQAEALVQTKKELAGASTLLAQEAKRIELDSVARLEAFKSQTTSAQTTLSGDLDVLKRTIANDIRPKQAQAEAEIAKQVEALSRTKNELSGVKSAQATYEETTTRRLSELTNLANGKASKSELTQTAEELASRIASVQAGSSRNYFRNSRSRTFTTGGQAVYDYRTFIVPDFWKNSDRFKRDYVRISFDVTFPVALVNDMPAMVHFSAHPWYAYRNLIFKGGTVERQHFEFTIDLSSSSEDYQTNNVFIRFGTNYGFPAGLQVVIENAMLSVGNYFPAYQPAYEDQEDRVSVVESNFKQRADSLDAGVSRLTEGLRTKADISSLNVTAENIRQSVKSLETDTQNKLNQKLSQAEFEVRAGSIRQEILNATKDKANKSELTQTAEELASKIASVQASGRNLFLNSLFKQDIPKTGIWTTSTYTATIDSESKYLGYKALKIIGLNPSGRDGGNPKVTYPALGQFGKVIPGSTTNQDVTISFYAKANKNGIMLRSRLGNIGYKTGNVTLSTEIKRYVVHIPKGWTNESKQTTNEWLFNFNQEGTVWIWMPKFEISDVDTSYSEAPEDIEGQISTVESTFKQRANSLEAGVNRLTEGLRTKADISSLNVTAENIRQSVKSLETDTQNKLNQKLSQAEFEVRAGSIRQEILNATKDKANKSELTQTAEELASKIASVQVGGINLLRNTASLLIGDRSKGCWMSSSGGNGRAISVEVLAPPQKMIKNMIRVIENTNGGNKDLTQLVRLRIGEKYTISCYARVASDSPNANVNLLFRSWANDTDLNRKFQKSISHKNWQKYSFTFTADAIENSIQFGQSGAGIIEICAPKIESGTLATDYSEAPEDIEGQISTVESTFKQRANSLEAGVNRLTEGLRTKADISSLNVTAENIRQSVKSLETDTQNKLNQKLSQVEFEVRAGSIRQEILNATKDKASKSELTQTAEELASRIASVQASGRNLFLNSLFKQDISKTGIWTTSTYTATIDSESKYLGHNALKIIGLNPSGRDGGNPKVTYPALGQFGKVIPGSTTNQDVTISFYAKANKNGIMLRSRLGNIGYKTGNVTLSTEIKRYVVHIPKGWTNESKQTTNEWLFNFNQEGTVWIWMPKFEISDVDTSYSEAPEDIEGQISTVESTFKQRANSLEAGVSRLTEGLRTKADISSLNVTAENIRQSVKSLETDTQNKLNQKLSQAEFEVRAGSIRQEILNATKDKASKSELTQTAEELSSKIASVQVGGRNYIRGTKRMMLARGLWASGTFRPSGAGTAKTIDVLDSPATGFDKAIRLTSSNARDQIGIAQDGFYISQGTYTMSCWVKGRRGQKVKLQTYWQVNDNSGISPIFTLKDENWTKLSFTSARNRAGVASIGYVYLVNAEVGEYLDVLAPQLEDGSLATSSKEAPEDIEGQISTVESTFKQRADSLDAGVRSLTEGLRTKADISSLNVTAENIRQSVKSLETDTQNKLNQKLSQAEFEVRAGSIRQEILNATKDKADKTLVVTEAGKLREEFSKMKVGGRNLWIKSKTVGAVIEKLPENHVTGQKECYRLENNSTLTFNLEPDFSSRLYQKVTFSAWIKYENVVQGRNFWNVFNCFKHYLFRKNSETGVQSGPDYATLGMYKGSADWKYITFTYDYSEKTNFDQLKTSLRFNLEGATSGTAWVTGIKVEIGSVATDWSPAPEDADGLITEAKATFERTAQGLRTDLSAIQEYVNKDGQRQEALQRYTREESTRQATAVRELVNRDFVGKATYQEDVKGINQRIEAVKTSANKDIASQIASYRQSVDGKFTDISSQITTYKQDVGGQISGLSNRLTSSEQGTTTQISNISNRINSNKQGTDNQISNLKTQVATNKDNAERQMGRISDQVSANKANADSQFANVTNQLARKVETTDFQRVKETSKLYERILGNTENGIADKVARMALTNQLFQVEVGKVAKGGRNYIRNGQFKNGSKNWLEYQSVNFGLNFNYQHSQNPNNRNRPGLHFYHDSQDVANFFGIQQSFAFDGIRGEKVSVSLLVSKDGGDSNSGLKVALHYIKNKNIIGQEWQNIPSPQITSKYKRFTFTFTLSDDVENLNLMLFGEKGKTINLYVTDVQLERGSVATDYKEAPEDTDEAIRSVQSQLTGSWAVQNINSAGDIISGINLGANGHNRFVGKLTHITGETLIDRAVIKSAMVDKLKTANFEAGSVTTTILDAEAVTADKVRFDAAFIRKMIANDAFIDQLTSKRIFSTKVESVISSSTFLEAYQGRIGGFTLGQFDQGGGRWISGVNQFSVGMGNGAGYGVRTAFWANWGNNWNYAGPKAWNVNTDGKMYCRNEVGFYDQVDFSNSSRANFYGNTTFSRSPVFSNGIELGSKDVLGDGWNPKGGRNAVVWWNQVGSGSVKYWMEQKSDRRLKENITDTAVKALDKINRLRMVAFDFIENKKHEEIGLIAQEAETIVPRIVSRDPENPDGYLHIDYTALVPYLIKAIQELNQKIEKMEKTIA